MRYYPGSPYCADKIMRAQDRLRLFELHPADSKILRDNFRKLEAHAAAQGERPAGRGSRVMVHKAMASLASRRLLPPPSRRGLVLIDPPYEDKDDYRRVQDALEDAFSRFPTGIYAVWYPVLQRMESRQLPKDSSACRPGSWLNVTLTGQHAVAGWLWPAQQRHVHPEPAVDAGADAARSDAIAGEDAGHRCRSRFYPRVRPASDDRWSQESVALDCSQILTIVVF